MAKARGSSSRRKAPATRQGTAPAGDPPAPAFARVHVWQIQAVRDVLFVGAVLFIVWLGYVLRTVTVPLLVALLLAYLFEPLIDWLSRRRRMNRVRAVSTLLAIIVVGVLLIAALVVPTVVIEGNKLVRDVRDGTMRQKISKVLDYVPGSFQERYRAMVSDWTEQAAEAPPTVAPPATPPDAESGQPPAEPALTEARVKEIVAAELRAQEAARDGSAVSSSHWFGLARGGVRAIIRFIVAVLGIGLVTVLIPFYFFFFSLWYPAVVRFGRGLIPERVRPRALELLGKMDLVVSGFVRGRIVISLIMGAMLAVLWSICDVPYAVVVGLVTGIFCAIPYLGGIGVPVAVGLLFFDRLGDPGNSATWWVWVLLWPTVFFGIVQVIEGYVLTPMIAGKVTGLDPVTILVAVLAGGSVLGVYGMLLAIPVTACLKILFTEVLLPRIRAWTRGEVADPLPIGASNKAT